eukprot:1774986-Pleurochrysis_carterae.AAC.2
MYSARTGSRRGSTNLGVVFWVFLRNVRTRSSRDEKAKIYTYPKNFQNTITKAARYFLWLAGDSTDTTTVWDAARSSNASHATMAAPASRPPMDWSSSSDDEEAAVEVRPHRPRRSNIFDPVIRPLDALFRWAPTYVRCVPRLIAWQAKLAS